MSKKQAESSPDPVLRREALASDVERFLKSGNKIEQIPTGVSAQATFGAAKPSQSKQAPKPAEEATPDADAKTK